MNSDCQSTTPIPVRGEHTCSRLKKAKHLCLFRSVQQPRCRRDAPVIQAALARSSGGFPSEIQSVALGGYRAGPLTLTHGDLRRAESHSGRETSHRAQRCVLSLTHTLRGRRCLPSTASSMFSSSLSMLQEAAGSPHRRARCFSCHPCGVMGMA